MISAFKENEYTAANCDCVELPKNAETGRRELPHITDLDGQHLLPVSTQTKLGS